MSHPTISNGKTNAAIGPAVPRNFRQVSMDRVIQCGGSWPGTCPEGPGPRSGPDPGVISWWGVCDGDCYLVVGAMGTQNPSFLGVITHFWGGFKTFIFHGFEVIVDLDVSRK